MKLAFSVPGRPQPKQRPRRGAGGRWYTPAETHAYERRVGGAAWVALAMAQLLRSTGGWPKDARYSLRVVVTPPDRRVLDGDNVLKAVQDGLNGALWNDDRQVVRAAYEMRLPNKKETGVEVEVEVLPSTREER